MGVGLSHLERELAQQESVKIVCSSVRDYEVGIHQLRFVPKGKSWTGEIEELWLDDQQLISRSHPQREVTLVGLMNELGLQGWELVTYAQPFTGYHGGCYTFKRSL